MSELIVTNGDAAAELLAAAGVRSKIIPWRDVLHEGPLQQTETLSDFSDRRAAYLSKRFDIPYADARADFLARDAIIAAHTMFDRVTIWLEHDLYDQLQLLQILSFFQSETGRDGLMLVQADDFLASQSPETILRFADHAVELDAEALNIGSGFWRALTMPTPEGLATQLKTPTRAFHFLRPALGRFIEELPSVNGGLSRSERTIVSAIVTGAVTPRDVFARLLAAEEAPFMGDWTVFRLLDDMVNAAQPLVSGPEDKFPCQGYSAEIDRYLETALAITPFGRAVIAGEADTIAVNGIDRWWAGTHLHGHDCWRWDAPSRRLVPPGGAD